MERFSKRVTGLRGGSASLTDGRAVRLEWVEGFAEQLPCAGSGLITVAFQSNADLSRYGNLTVVVREVVDNSNAVMLIILNKLIDLREKI